jgi:hypothetical protein
MLHCCGKDYYLWFLFLFCLFLFLCYLLSVLHKERKATFLHRDTLDCYYSDFAWRPGVMSEREREAGLFILPPPKAG